MNKYNGTDFEDLGNLWEESYKEQNGVIKENINSNTSKQVIKDTRPYSGSDFDNLGDLYLESSHNEDKENKDTLDGNKNEQEFQTYSAWKRAVKNVDPDAKFTGDKDIDGCYKKGKYDAEWDGEKGKLVLTEGFMDRMKARGDAAMGAVKDTGSNIARAGRNIGRTISGDRKSTFETGKNVAGRYQDKKAYNIVSSHYKRLQKQLSDFATDIVKLGIVNEDEAERIASESMSALKNNQDLRKLVGRKSL